MKKIKQKLLMLTLLLTFLMGGVKAYGWSNIKLYSDYQGSGFNENTTFEQNGSDNKFKLTINVSDITTGGLRFRLKIVDDGGYYVGAKDGNPTEITTAGTAYECNKDNGDNNFYIPQTVLDNYLSITIWADWKDAQTWNVNFTGEAIQDMYLIGESINATQYWTTNPTVKMTSKGGGIFTWTGTISGNFALVSGTNYASWDAMNVNRYATGVTVSPGTFNLTTGDKNSSLKDGTYTLIYNSSTKKLTILPPSVYLVGDFNEWNKADDNYKFTDNEDGTYTLNDVSLTTDKSFKVYATNSDDAYWFGGYTGSDNYYEINSSTLSTDIATKAEDAYKNFYVASNGTYNVTINFNTNTVRFEKSVDIYLMGENIGSSPQGLAMTKSGSTFTWEGMLHGWFAFTSNDTDNWDTANSNRYGPSTDQTIAISSSTVGDTQTHTLINTTDGNSATAFWVQGGTYKLTFDYSTKQLTVEVKSTDVTDYYLVSNLSGGEKKASFKLSPSRIRQGGAESVTYYTYHLQDFLLDAKHNNTNLQFYIEDSNGKKYMPLSTDNNYELADKANAEESTYPGNGVVYYTYGTHTATSGSTYYFQHTLNKFDSQSFTIMFDPAYVTRDGAEGQVALQLNPSNMGNATAASSYYLVGNFGQANASVQLRPDLEESRRQLTKYYYKDGLQYTSEPTPCDSIVYRVTVNKPDAGWGELYLLVFRGDDIEGTSQTDWVGDGSNVTDHWAKAIRPQTQWNRDESIPSYGYDGTALRGGLYSRQSGAKDMAMAINPQLSVKYANATAYTFTINETTSTYHISFNNNLFLMGPAVSASSSNALAAGKNDYDSDVAVAWSSDDPTEETTHALKLVYHSTDNSYRYEDGSGNEKQVYMVNGQRFAFVWDKNFQDASYFEDNVRPVSLVDASGNLNINAYKKNDEDQGNYDTQFVNFLSINKLDSETFNPAEEYAASGNSLAEDEYTVDGVRFQLPTGLYKIRLYMPTIKEKQYVYYVVSDREYDFYSPGATATGANTVGSFNAKAGYRTFSDYHAVIIPEGIEVKYLSDATRVGNTNKGNVIMGDYPLVTENGQSRILPANTPVLLVYNTALSQFKNTFAEKFEYYGPNPKLANTMSETNLLQPSVAAASIEKYVGDKENWLFGYKKLEGDTQYTIGFYHPGAGTFSINSAYLQVGKNLVGDYDTMNPSAVISIGYGDLTGIDSVDEPASEQVNESAVYTLDGRKVATGQLVNSSTRQLPKGVYIVNGKKVVVK